MPDPPELVARANRSGIHALLGVEIVEASAERVVLRLEVGPDVHQPFGLLHGGVSALLAESAASIGGAHAAEEGTSVVGIELSDEAGRTICVSRCTLAVVDAPPG